MRNFGNINIVVKTGEVTTGGADCIVVPQFHHMVSSNGVGHKILVAGMSAGMEKYQETVLQKPFEFGDMMMTESGKRGVKLAHVVTLGTDSKEQPLAISKSIFSMLVSANDQQLQRIVIPELGTGIIGYLTQEQSAQIIFNAVYEFVGNNPKSSIKQVSLIVSRKNTEPALRVLKKKIYKKFPENMIGYKQFSPATWFYESKNKEFGE